MNYSHHIADCPHNMDKPLKYKLLHLLVKGEWWHTSEPSLGQSPSSALCDKGNYFKVAKLAWNNKFPYAPY